MVYTEIRRYTNCLTANINTLAVAKDGAFY